MKGMKIIFIMSGSKNKLKETAYSSSSRPLPAKLSDIACGHRELLSSCKLMGRAKCNIVWRALLPHAAALESAKMEGTGIWLQEWKVRSVEKNILYD